MGSRNVGVDISGSIRTRPHAAKTWRRQWTLCGHAGFRFRQRDAKDLNTAEEEAMCAFKEYFSHLSLMLPLLPFNCLVCLDFSLPTRTFTMRLLATPQFWTTSASARMVDSSAFAHSGSTQTGMRTPLWSVFINDVLFFIAY